MVINHLLTGMILQVRHDPNYTIHAYYGLLGVFFNPFFTYRSLPPPQILDSPRRYFPWAISDQKLRGQCGERKSRRVRLNGYEKRGVGSFPVTVANEGLQEVTGMSMEVSN